MQKQSNEAAPTSYSATVVEIQELLVQIRKATNDHFSAPGASLWDQLGDAKWTRNQLKHVLAVIRGEEGK